MEQKSNRRRAKGPRRQKGKRRGTRRNGDTSTGASAFPTLSSDNTTTGMSIRSMPLFGQRTRRVVQYSFTGSVTSGAGSAGAYVFSANGLYDPDITGSGHQPMGFDQMMTFYNHYTVTRSRIRVNAAVVGSAAPVVALHVSGSATPETVATRIMETGRVTLLWLTTLGAATHGSLQASVNLGKFQGLKNVIDDPDMRGDSASNPAEQVYFIIYCWWPLDSTVAGAGFQGVIEFDTIFHEPRTPTQS